MKTPATLSDKDAVIAALVERIEVMVAANVRLVARVAELEARLGLPLSKGHKRSLSSEPKRMAKPYPGAQRLLHPAPTRHRDVWALSCQACGVDALGAEQSPCEVYDRIEIPAIVLDATRVSLHRGGVPALREAVQGQGAGGPGTGLALPSQQPGLRGLPVGRAGHLAGATARPALRPLRPVDRRGRAGQDVGGRREPFRATVSLIKARLLAGTALASDETGVRVRRANWWPWVFHHGDSAVFMTVARRSRAVVATFLGDRRPDF